MLTVSIQMSASEEFCNHKHSVRQLFAASPLADSLKSVSLTLGLLPSKLITG